MDASLHQRAVEKLARKRNRPVAPVRIVYENEHARLKIDSKVMKLLDVFASRRSEIRLTTSA
jgi:hypothetical protein